MFYIKILLPTIAVSSLLYYIFTFYFDSFAGVGDIVLFLIILSLIILTPILIIENFLKKDFLIKPFENMILFVYFVIFTFAGYTNYSKNTIFVNEEISSFVILNQDLSKVEFKTTDGTIFNIEKPYIVIQDHYFSLVKSTLSIISTDGQKCTLYLKKYKGKLVDFIYSPSDITCVDRVSPIIPDFNSHR